MIALRDVQAARTKIARYIHKTPLIHSNSLSALSGAEVWLKLENLQKTGSFKVRGAFNKLLAVDEERIVAASMGNHGQAVAFAAGKLGKKALIVMPATAAIVKEEATRGYGAEVALTGDSLADALAFARAQKGAVFIHPYDDEAVIAGQGTVGLEITEDLADIAAVFVPVGGGGLIAGAAVAVKTLAPDTAVVGVQAEAAPAAFFSFQERAISERAPRPTIADGIAVARPGDLPFGLISRYVDEMLLAGEDAISRAILLFLERKKLVVEGAAAVTLAALLGNGERFRGKRIVLVLSGGNIDFTVVDRIVRKGLATSGRIGVVEVMVSDRPGSLSAVTGALASLRANIIDVAHDRFGADLPVDATRVVFTLEIRNRKHLADVVSKLLAQGYEARERR